MLALRHAGVFLFRLSVLVLQAAAFCVAYVLAVLYDWAVAQITLTAAERAYVRSSSSHSHTNQQKLT